jgi:hypothetical protein
MLLDQKLEEIGAIPGVNQAYESKAANLALSHNYDASIKKKFRDSRVVIGHAARRQSGTLRGAKNPNPQSPDRLRAACLIDDSLFSILNSLLSSLSHHGFPRSRPGV